MSDTKQPIPNVSIFAERGAEMDVIALMRRKGDPGLYAANATVGGISTSYTTLRWREVVVDDEQDAKAIDMALPKRAAR
ncbi:hypothetical protein [Burkholderia ubonensis]|uniref:hypothetical protein n=1 Tax=Burkholderia ubonensis TaxID=101571 RepID=UPI000756F535|nr:hypothetical protein [Burkholderia ubonensis]KWC67208.1 hypothetical protein WL54_03555 [Burkholderia ubonensis]